MLMMCLVVLSLLIGSANAEVIFRDTTFFGYLDFVPCAAGGGGEPIYIEGPIHTQISLTINGNNASGNIFANVQGMTATGLITGQKYQVVGMIQQSFKQSCQNGQITSTNINNYRVIGQGPGNNFLLRETLHYTINANGDVTVYHDNISTGCN